MPGYRKQMRRYEIEGHGRYLTFSTFNRLPLFQNDAIEDAIVKQICCAQQRLRFDVYAWVIVPEHVHLLILPDLPEVTVTDLVLAIKRPFANRVLSRWRELKAGILSRVCDSAGKAHFWQAGGGYDRNIFGDAEVIEKIQYIHNNPVRRGLVAAPSQWRWSSARWYAGMEYDGPGISQRVALQ